VSPPLRSRWCAIEADDLSIGGFPAGATLSAQAGVRLDGNASDETIAVSRLPQLRHGQNTLPISITTSERRTAASDDSTVNSYPHFLQQR
jgi:hypothetical protein